MWKNLENVFYTYSCLKNADKVYFDLEESLSDQGYWKQIVKEISKEVELYEPRIQL